MTGVQLEVQATQYNVKKLDPDAYGCKGREAYVLFKMGSVEKKTTILSKGLDGCWDEADNTFQFDVTDINTNQLEAQFYMGGVALGVVTKYNLDSLKENKPTYKGFAPPGGKVDIQLRAIGFGLPDVEEEADDSWMTAEGGMGGGDDDEC